MLYTNRIFLNTGRTASIYLDENQIINFSDIIGTIKVTAVGKLIN